MTGLTFTECEVSSLLKREYSVRCKDMFIIGKALVNEEFIFMLQALLLLSTAVGRTLILQQFYGA